MQNIPNIPKNINDPSFGYKVEESARQAWLKINELRNKYDEIVKKLDEIKNIKIQPSTNIIEIIREISNPINNVQGQQGQLNQVQLAGIPKYSSLPSTLLIGNDPNLQDTALIRIGNLLYIVDEKNRAFIQIGTLFITSSSEIIVSGGVTTQQFLMQISLASNFFNSLNRTIRLNAEGFYSTQAGQMPTYKFEVNLDGTGGDNLATFVSNATTASTTDGWWQMEIIIVTSGNGASGSLEVSGNLRFQPAASPVADFRNFVSIISASSIDLTIAHSLDFLVTISTQPGGLGPYNSCSQRMLVVENLGG